jgi:hypothetical protein
MAEPSRNADSEADVGDDVGVRPSRGSKHRRPRWLKLSLIIVVAVVVVVILMLTGVLGGGHGQFGPGQHG